MADKPALMTTTLWDFPSQQYGDETQGDQEYQGATPAYIVWNLLTRYTQPKDLVVDPMAGSGTTLDVARDLGRRALGYDLQSTRSDLFRCDARHLPLEDAKADFVFVDPPYSTHVDYGPDPRCIGRLDAAGAAYFEAMAQVIAEIDRVLRPGRHMALYVCDSFLKGKPLSPIGFELFALLRRHFEPVDIVAVVRRNRTLLRRNWHTAAEEGNYFLRGFNYLFIMRKPEKPAERTTDEAPSAHEPADTAQPTPAAAPAPRRAPYQASAESPAAPTPRPKSPGAHDRPARPDRDRPAEQSERPSRQERAKRPDRPERPARPDRPSRPTERPRSEPRDDTRRPFPKTRNEGQGRDDRRPTEYSPERRPRPKPHGGFGKGSPRPDEPRAPYRPSAPKPYGARPKPQGGGTRRAPQPDSREDTRRPFPKTRPGAERRDDRRSTEYSPERRPRPKPHGGFGKGSSRSEESREPYRPSAPKPYGARPKPHGGGPKRAPRPGSGDDSRRPFPKARPAGEGRDDRRPTEYSPDRPPRPKPHGGGPKRAPQPGSREESSRPYPKSRPGAPARDGRRPAGESPEWRPRGKPHRGKSSGKPAPKARASKPTENAWYDQFRDKKRKKHPEKE